MLCCIFVRQFYCIFVKNLCYVFKGNIFWEKESLVCWKKFWLLSWELLLDLCQKDSLHHCRWEKDMMPRHVTLNYVKFRICNYMSLITKNLSTDRGTFAEIPLTNPLTLFTLRLPLKPCKVATAVDGFIHAIQAVVHVTSRKPCWHR